VMNLINNLSSAWSIIPDRLSHIIDILDAHLRGPKLSLKDIEARILAETPQPQTASVKNGVAIIDITGVLMKNPDIFDRIFMGASSMSQIKTEILNAVNDPAVSRIILNIDSPGGTVDGTEELAQTIFESRGKKQITAYTDGYMTSAAYWVGSSADKIYISGDTTNVGSIGVITAHYDYTEAARAQGVKVTEFVTGKYKNAGSDFRSIDDTSSEYIQGRIDYILGVFAGAVIRNRGLNAEKIDSEIFEAKVYIGKQAITAGLVDGVSTLDDLIAGNPATNISAGALESNIKTPQEDNMELNSTILKKDHEAIYTEVFEAGKKAAIDGMESKIKEDIKNANDAGRLAESERIKSIQAIATPGNEDLIKEMMFDGKTTAGEAAIKIINADNAKRAANLDALKKDKKDVHVADAKPEDKIEADKTLPVEERAKATWEKSVDIRSEFGSYETYLAYMKNMEAGNVKIKSGGK
jgi:capsid assembly protease